MIPQATSISDERFRRYKLRWKDRGADPEIKKRFIYNFCTIKLQLKI
jgi:hypothetical protein